MAAASEALSMVFSPDDAAIKRSAMRGTPSSGSFAAMRWCGRHVRLFGLAGLRSENPDATVIIMVTSAIFTAS
jgi:hypothetical protein